ncbi:MAG TPA: LPS assembly lipoprotein LptE [Pseudomonadales bacterium]|jgi:LPS-assembly lipoprotein|nr:LPS assembly lipoprotein LptE [Pseudomonadales bacterium]
MTRRALLAAALLLSGCGYHLRGASVETSIPSAYVRGSEGVEVTDDLKRALRQSGVQILDTVADATVTIDLMQQTQSTRTLSYTDRATTAESQLELAIRFKVVGSAEKELLPERWARATRTYLVDTNNLVGSNQQQVLMDSELKSDVVQQIMRSVSAAGRQLQKPH